MGFNESKNVTFSDSSYEAEVTTCISYEMSRKSAKLIWPLKVKVRMPESFKVGWYPPKKTGPSHLNK